MDVHVDCDGADKEEKLKRDRLRKSKYRQEKMAEMRHLKMSVSALQHHLSQLQKGQQLPRLPSLDTLTHRPESCWKHIALMEKARMIAAVNERNFLVHELEHSLQKIYHLQTHSQPRQLVMDPRLEPTQYTLDAIYPKRIDLIHKLLDWQLQHMTDDFMTSVLPSIDSPEPLFNVQLTDDKAAIAYFEVRKQGVIYASSAQVGHLLWHFYTTLRPSSSIKLLDGHCCIIQTNCEDGVHYSVAKRYVQSNASGQLRETIIVQSIVADETHRKAQQGLSASWHVEWLGIVIEELARNGDSGDIVSVLRGVQQTDLNTPSTIAYTKLMIDAVKSNDALNTSLRQHFAVLALN